MSIRSFGVLSAHIVLSTIMIKLLQQESSKFLCLVSGLRRYRSFVLMIRLCAQTSWRRPPGLQPYALS